MTSERPSILLVDDQPNNLKILYEVLSERNYDVQIVTSGTDALELLETLTPHLILLDVMIPGMNGFELCSRLKANKRTRDIPVIFLTALSDTINRIRGFEVGGVDYLIKPIEIKEIISKIHTHLTLCRLLAREREIARLKSHLVSIACHDLRIPLNILLSANSSLKYHAEWLSNAEMIRQIDMIEDAGRKMLAILDSLLVYSRIESRRTPFCPEYMNMFNFCKQIADVYSQLTGYAHDIVLSCPESLELIFDPKLMRHVISNVLSNAIQYSPAGTRIEFSVWEQGDETVIQITDQGPGIPEKDLNNVFEPFYRGGNVGQTRGTGLGLCIAKHFVELHQGTIALKSAEGRGLSVIIKLPGTNPLRSPR